MKSLNTAKLGSILKEKRRERCFNLRDLSKLINIPIATLSRIERANMPDVNTLIQVLEFIQVPFEELCQPDEFIEIEKTIYNEKPTAVRQLDFSKNLWCYYTETSIGGVHFEVPISDMGKNKFPDRIPAHRLTRWIKGMH